MKKIRSFIFELAINIIVVILILLAAAIDLGNQLSSNDIKKLEKVDYSQINISDIIK